MRQILITISLAALVAGCASNKESKSGMGSPQSSPERVGGASSTLAAQDSTFIREAGQAGMAEVKIAQLATKNTQTDAVRKYAQTLIDDHTKANTELKQTASNKGATIDTSLGKHQATYDKLAGLKDREFDQQFKQVAIKDHEEAIKLFEKESQSGSDSELKAFAQKCLPKLRHHLTMAQQLEGGQTTLTPTGRDSSNTSSESKSSDTKPQQPQQK